MSRQIIIAAAATILLLLCYETLFSLLHVSSSSANHADAIIDKPVFHDEPAANPAVDVSIASTVRNPKPAPIPNVVVTQTHKQPDASSIPKVVPVESAVTAVKPAALEVTTSKLVVPEATPVEPATPKVAAAKRAVPGSSGTNSFADAFPSNRQCPSSVHSLYLEPERAFDESAFSWCKSNKKSMGVVIGKTWGRLSKQGQKQWDIYKCNDYLAESSGGKKEMRSCDEKWGWSLLKDWASNVKTVVPSTEVKQTDGTVRNIGSSVKCGTNHVSAQYCKYNRVVVDFSKGLPSGQQRHFSPGFVTAYSSVPGAQNAGGVSVPGFTVEPLTSTERSLAEKNPGSYPARAHCDVIETRPTFIMSHDDIYNLGHHVNDVMMVWAMVVMAGRAANTSLFINMDGIRRGGPAGGPPHRLMNANNPDANTPYLGYYSSWFNQLARAVEYKSQRVCFDEVYFQAFPGTPWFWNDWGIINECSKKAPSPLYQSYNVYMRRHWEKEFGIIPTPDQAVKKLLSSPDSTQPLLTGGLRVSDVVHIVIEVRKIIPSKAVGQSTSRYIRNLKELMASFRAIPGVVVTAQDFAALPFKEQVALSHAAGVFVSMHGAGTTHIFHSAIGENNCCALMELQPEKTVGGFYEAHGFGYIARNMGMGYARHVPADGSTSKAGTVVDVAAITTLVSQLVVQVRGGDGSGGSDPLGHRTCLHDVRDASQPLLRGLPFSK